MNAAPDLRPLSIGDLFDTAFQLYRSHFTLFLGIVAVLMVPMTILKLASLALFGTTGFVDWIQNLLVINLASGTLASAIAQIYLGRSVSIGGAYQVGRRRFGALVLAALAQGLIVAGPIVLVGLCFLGASVGAGLSDSFALIGLLILLALLPALLLLIRFLVSTQAIVLEGCGATEGLKRSWRLTSGAFWRVFGVAIAVGLLTVLLAQIPANLVSYLLSMAQSSISFKSQEVVTLVISQIGLILAMPVQLAVNTLLYYDLRVRNEGFDLELLAQQTILA